jgi:ferrous-iron efflux pump FieF
MENSSAEAEKLATDDREARTLAVTVAVYVVIFGVKLAAALATGVMALMAEALHTSSDIFISGFLLIAARFSSRPSDEVHMFGYGRAQNAAALVAATLFISFTSLRLYEEAIPRLLAPADSEYQHLPIAVGVLVGSAFLAGAPLLGLFRRRQKGAAARAQFLELINDELGLVAALIGTLLLAAGYPIADPIAAIVVATIIAYNGVRLFWENLCVLLGRSPGRSFLAELERQARSVEGVLAVHGTRAESVGPDRVHAELHVQVARGTSIEEADRIAHEVLRRIDGVAGCVACSVHVDPAPPGVERATTATALAA